MAEPKYNQETPATKGLRALGDWLTSPVDRTGLDKMPGANFPPLDQRAPPTPAETPKPLEPPKNEAPKAEARPGTWGEPTQSTFVGPPKSLMSPAATPRGAALFPTESTPGPVDPKFGGGAGWTRDLPANGASLFGALSAPTSTPDAKPAPVAPTTPGPGAGGYERLPDTDIYRKTQPDGSTTWTQPGVSAVGGANPAKPPGPGRESPAAFWAWPARRKRRT